MDTPPPELSDLITQAVVTGSLALAALGVTAWRGKLWPDVLTSAPLRSVTLQFHDLLAVGSLMLLGMVTGSSLFLLFPADDPITKAILIIPVALISYALAMAFLFYRLTHPKPQSPGIAIPGNDLTHEPVETENPEGDLFAGDLPIEVHDKGSDITSWGLGAFGLGMFRLSHLKTAALGVMLALPVVFAANTLMSLLMHVMGGEPPASGHELLTWFAETDHKALLLGLLMVSVVIIAPIMEEIVYRGVVQTWLIGLLGPNLRWLVLILASALFASVHLGNVPWEVLPALFLLGVILGWVYETTRSLWPCMIIHAIFNAINLCLALLIS